MEQKLISKHSFRREPRKPCPTPTKIKDGKRSTPPGLLQRRPDSQRYSAIHFRPVSQSSGPLIRFLAPLSPLPPSSPAIGNFRTPAHADAMQVGDCALTPPPELPCLLSSPQGVFQLLGAGKFVKESISYRWCQTSWYRHMPLR